jgi:putative sigma-54 modulation protein
MAVQVTVRGRNLEVTEALRRYTEKKLSRLGKYFTLPLRAQVAMRVERGRHIVEVTIPLDGITLRAEESSGDMYASLDLVVDKLERQVRKFKTRINRKARRTGVEERRPLVMEEGEEDEAEGEEDGVVRVKRFALKPMDVEEAILQLNLLGHDFFVFRNGTTGAVNVVYRRREGGYGLIEPEP